MNKEEYFKKKLHDLLEGREFSFEEKDWLEAEKVIKFNRGERKRRFLFYFLALSVFLGGLLAFLLKPHSNRTRTAEQNKTLPIERIQASPTVEMKIALPNPTLVKTKSTVIKQTFPPKKIVVQKQQPETPMPGSGSKTPALQATNDAEVNSNPSMNIHPEADSLQRFVYETYSTSPKNEDSPGSDQSVDSTSLPIDLAIIEAPSSSGKSKLDTLESPTVQNLTTSDSIQKPDSISKGSDASLAIPEPVRNIMFSAEAGFSYLFGWQSGGQNEGRGLNPMIGMNYHNVFRNKFTYSLGLHFTSVGHLRSFSDTSKVTSYKFGEESDVTIIQPRTCYYLDVPLYLSWNFAKRQSFGVGIHLSYLINVFSAVKSYHESLSISEEHSSNAWGYSDGFSSYNFQFGFFYRRELIKNLYIQPALLIGLIDLKDDVFFNSATKERSSGIKLSLLYSLKNY